MCMLDVVGEFMRGCEIILMLVVNLRVTLLKVEQTKMRGSMTVGHWYGLDKQFIRSVGCFSGVHRLPDNFVSPPLEVATRTILTSTMAFSCIPGIELYSRWTSFLSNNNIQLRQSQGIEHIIIPT